MSDVTFPYPLADAVRRNPFREKSGHPHAIPSFADARPLLPQPMLPDRPGWEEMYWRAWEIGWSHLRRPGNGSGLVASFIEPAFNNHIFMWDTAFMVQFGLYGRRAFPFIRSLDNFYASQHDNGFICREIDEESGADYFHPFDPNGAGPNILAWAEWRYYRLTGDDGRLPQIFWPLLAYHRWYRAHRTWRNGLYWATGLSSGMDNQPRVPDSRLHHRHWAWVDASMQAALNGRLLQQMAIMLEEEALAESLAAERLALVELINDAMWNPEQLFYQDVAPDGRFSRVKSIGAYWGLLDDGLIPAERRGPFIQHLRDSWAFNLPHRAPSQSADSDGYNAESGHYWRGAVWSPTNFMVLKGLRAAGEDALAHAIARNHLDNVYSVYERTDTFWENYAPETAAPGQPAKSNFVGWTGLTPIAILLEDVIGIQVDWPLRRVVWDRRLETEAAYGVRNLPLGGGETLSLVGDREAVEVTSDAPLTLIVRDGGESLQAAVPAGTTTLSLA